MNKRVEYFDIAKGIGIILVILCHIEYVPLDIRRYIVTFHMPVFFVISGMLMNLTREVDRPLGEILKRKLFNIMVPYLIFSVIFPITDVFRYAHQGIPNPSSALLSDILVGFSMTGISVLWFLPALFFSELIVLAFAKNIKKPLFEILTIAIASGIWILSFILEPMSLMFRRTIICTVLVLAGYLSFNFIDRLRRYPWACLGISAAGFVILYFTENMNDIVDLHYIILGKWPLYYFNALLGSFALVLISMFLEAVPTRKVSAILAFYGKNSLFIMITHIHFFVLYVCERVASAVQKPVEGESNLVFNLISMVLVLILEALLIRLWHEFKNVCSKTFVSRNQA